MFKMIMKYWTRNFKRFILLLIGTILISAGLISLIGLSETNKGTIINALEEKWQASYDIVVRPQGEESITEKNNSMDPNYLSGLSGGISFEELDSIKNIEGVDIAAPISVLGYTMIGSPMGEFNLKQNGIYRMTNKFIQNDGIRDYIMDVNTYHAIGIDTSLDSFETAKRYDLSVENQEVLELSGIFTILLAAIDPQEEARLVGLDQSVLENNNSRYFHAEDSFESYMHEGIGAQVTRLPILLSTDSSVDYEFSFNLEKLDVSLDSDEEINVLLEEIEKNDGSEYLDTLSSTPINSFEFNSKQAYNILIESLLTNDSGEYLVLNEKASPLNYEKVPSPFPDRWSSAFKVDVPMHTSDVTNDILPIYREVKLYHEDMSKLPRIEPKYIGVYDPSKLNISIDPITKVPMETYRTPTATYVLDKNENPVNPPKTVKATTNPFGYIMQSPTMLTTIEASKEFLGERPISAIRIKVKGSENFGDDSQQKLERIVSEIESNTDLKADTTLGSSPQPFLINIPQVDGVEELGWIEQPWIKKGVSINILKETKLGFSGLIVCLIIVSIMYVFTTNFINYLSRKQEFALLKSLGWKNSNIIRMVVTESIMLSGIVTVISFIVLFILKSQHTDSFSFVKIMLIVLFTLFIYIIGSLWPSYLITKISPLQVLKQGEISIQGARFGRTRGIISIVFNNIFGRWLRNAVSILAISLPSALFILYMFVSLRLDGVLYTSWLGEYVAMEVSTPHYIAISLSLMIAILTAGEMIWQNVVERTNEIALFKALGWKNRNIQTTVLIEGALLGLLSGVLSLIFGLILVTILYGTLTINQFLFYCSVLILTVFVGTISALIPSLSAVRIEPIKELK